MEDTHPPLLEAGFHELKGSQLEEMFVAPFAQPARRQDLVDRFRTYLREIDDALDISYECWIDGSFTSEKLKPNDIDVLFVLERHELNQMDATEQRLFVQLFQQRREIRLRYQCDVYFCMSDEDAKKSYWRDWFGFSRGEQVKGIGRITRAKDTQRP